MDIATTAGAKISISNAAVITSVTDTTAEYAALTYIEVKQVESLGDFGDQSNLVNFTSLADARVRKLKGSRDAGELALVVANVADDPGQVALIAAEKTKFLYAFKVEFSDKGPGSGAVNTTIYFAALVNSGNFSVGGADDVIRSNYSLPIDTPLFITPATPGT
jgi:hypothetical protein